MDAARLKTSARWKARSAAEWLRAPIIVALCLAIFGGMSAVRAADTIPPKPTRYFNDFALAVKPETADRLNKALEDLEKQTSNQVVAVIYPRMQSDSDVADYCQRVFRAWNFGQKDKNNGAVLFVFLEDRKSRIQTGYGLEGALPDAICKRILSDEMAPYFKAKDFDGGMTAGVEAMIKATQGEYKGDGTTKYQREHGGSGSEAEGGGGGVSTIVLLLVAAFFIFSAFSRRRRGGTLFTGGGPVFLPTSFGGGGFGGGSSGGGGSSDGGGFISSGGGDSGGGGASGDW